MNKQKFQENGMNIMDKETFHNDAMDIVTKCNKFINAETEHYCHNVCGNQADDDNELLAHCLGCPLNVLWRMSRYIAG